MLLKLKDFEASLIYVHRGITLLFFSLSLLFTSGVKQRHTGHFVSFFIYIVIFFSLSIHFVFFFISFFFFLILFFLSYCVACQLSFFFVFFHTFILLLYRFSIPFPLSLPFFQSNLRSTTFHFFFHLFCFCFYFIFLSFFHARQKKKK